MKSLKGTKTEKNLMEAFAGESQAAMKYGYYASKAKKDGFEEIAAIFAETQGNEKEHAKLWFKYLHGNEVPCTEANLKDAMTGEHFETTNMYKRMAEEAKKEGFTEIAKKFAEVGKIEARHEARYKKFLAKVNKKEVFVRKSPIEWICLNCGTVIKAKTAPKICPVCNHPQAYFKPYQVEK